MSIELKQAAQQAVYAFDAFGDADDFASLFELTQKMRALRTAIQQAEAQQPATPEPVAYVDRDGFIIETGLLLTPGTKLYTHPAPNVPADVVRDAERYRFIRDADVSDDLIPDIALYAMESLDEYIDAAMLAAKEGGAA